MDTIKRERTAKNKIAHPQQHIILFKYLNTKCNNLYLYSYIIYHNIIIVVMGITFDLTNEKNFSDIMLDIINVCSFSSWRHRME